jgi:hypothetical protein
MQPKVEISSLPIEAIGALLEAYRQWPSDRSDVSFFLEESEDGFRCEAVNLSSLGALLRKAIPRAFPAAPAAATERLIADATGASPERGQKPVVLCSPQTPRIGIFWTTPEELGAKIRDLSHGDA